MRVQVKYAAELYALSSITLIQLLQECETIPEAIQALEYAEDKKEQYALEMALLQKKEDEIYLSWAAFEGEIGRNNAIMQSYEASYANYEEYMLSYGYDFAEDEVNISPSDREIRLILLAREFAERYDPLILDDMVTFFFQDYDLTSEERMIFCNALNEVRYAECLQIFTL